MTGAAAESPANWPDSSDRPVPVLAFRWTDTYVLLFSEDHILTIGYNELELAAMPTIPEFVSKSKEHASGMKLNLAGIEQFEQLLPTIKAIMRGDAPAASPSLYIKHFE